MIVSKSRSPQSNLFVFASLVVVALLGGAHSANAGSVIMLSLDQNFSNAVSAKSLLPDNPYGVSSTSLQTAVSGPGAGGGLNFFNPDSVGISGLSISATLTTNFPGKPLLASMQASTTQITNNTGAAVSFYIGFGVDSFTLPNQVPVYLQTVITATVTNGNQPAIATDVTGTAWVNNVSTATTGAPGSGWMSGPSAGPVFGTGVWSGSTFITTLSNPFSVYTEYYVTVADGNTINIISQTTLTSPEPASMTLLGIGVLGLAGYAWRKRLPSASCV